MPEVAFEITAPEVATQFAHADRSESKPQWQRIGGAIDPNAVACQVSNG